MTPSDDYKDELRRIRSLLIVTELQKKIDLKAIERIQKLGDKFKWNAKTRLMIDIEAWRYVVTQCGYQPELIFCHPEALLAEPSLSLYYRCLTGLSRKAAQDYVGPLVQIESGSSDRTLDEKKALVIAQTYNTFISSIIRNSVEWTLENGYRTVIATLGITLDGAMRNKVGDIAEDRIRIMILGWLLDRKLIVDPDLTKADIRSNYPHFYILKGDITMRFGSEPDISLLRGDLLVATVEIKGGVDPAGALERYGAATKSFQHAISQAPQCRNFYVAGVFTDQVRARIAADRLVEASYDIVELLDDPQKREGFLIDVFHHTLRIM
jgi:hypothetical protein